MLLTFEVFYLLNNFEGYFHVHQLRELIKKRKFFIILSFRKIKKDFQEI